ncbi:MAG: leucine-rich repeat domain-containing protein [Ruminococcus sp.]|nr:leucine-rich repeat domain-containing protein [Ruminococcus sp.]MDE6848826.1 leucine-rich repeat domain-containing protein [Ruminococcus sp.]MDE7137817.1 leucine-rich repeat domain-containing protein [Ruminococcus sp.]
MKISKVIAGLMAVCIMGMVCPTLNNVSDKIIAFASSEYTEGTYETLSYKNYGDYIEISGCYKSVTDVVIPSEIGGVPVTSIGGSAFYGCKNLISIIIPEGVTRIESSAFEGCENLTSIEILNPDCYIYDSENTISETSTI